MHKSADEEWEDEGDAEAAEVIAAISNPADLSIDLIRPDLIERVFKSLTADADRGGGQLKRSDINRTYVRKQLSIAECIEVEGRLASAIRVIVEDDEEVPLDNSAGESTALEHKVRYLTHAEERDLGRRIRIAAQLPNDTSNLDASYVQRVKRDAQKARNEFVVTNLRYVEMIAQRYGERRYIETDDLKQEGLIGLLRAVELYDPERGFRFKTYATWWIEQRITRALADDDRIVRLPVHLHEKLMRIRRARSKLTFSSGRPPTEGELADALGEDRERLMKLLWRVQATEVIDGDSLIGEDDTLLSIVPDQGASLFEVLTKRELEERIEAVFSTLLTPREARILRMRFGLGLDQDHTLESVGKQFNLTRERIRQIEAKALDKLRHPNNSHMLRDFLDY